MIFTDSPDIVFYDFFSFSKLKKFMKGVRFSAALFVEHEKYFYHQYLSQHKKIVHWKLFADVKARVPI